MEDVFYFSRALVSQQDIVNVSEEAGYRWKLWAPAGGSDPYLNVYFDKQRFWHFLLMSEENGGSGAFEPLARRLIADWGSLSAYDVAHHADSWPELRLFLKRVMERFGGWVGSDTDDLHPTFTAETIESAIYPYPLGEVPVNLGSKATGGRS